MSRFVSQINQIRATGREFLTTSLVPRMLSLQGRGKKVELRFVPTLIDFAQHFIAIVLDEQSLIVGEWPIHLNARNQVFTCTSKFMHVLFEVHEGTFLFLDRIANSGASTAL